jgi:hypothetical protein
MEEALIAYLLATPAITSLTGTRIYWMEIPQGSAYPAVRLQVISTVPDYTYEGAQGLKRSRVQVDCYAGSYLGSKAVARTIETLISGEKFTQGPVRFEGCFMDAERDGFEPTAPPDKLFLTSLDFIVNYKGD